MKVRIHKQDDDNIAVEVFPWHLKEAGQTDEEFMDSKTINHTEHGKKFIGKEYHDLHVNDLPPREHREKWYPDFEHPTEKIKIDHNWERKLMPLHHIKNKHTTNIITELDNELNKKNPDTIRALRFYVEHEKSKKLSEKEWYEQAIINLDAKVAKGEADKPIVREKLLAKIQQLKGDES